MIQSLAPLQEHKLKRPYLQATVHAFEAFFNLQPENFVSENCLYLFLGLSGGPS
jgi:hypothetical protein